MRLPPWLLTADHRRADLIVMAAGMIAALALPPLNIVPVLLLSFPLLMAFVARASGSLVAARRGWWFGFGYHLIGLYWITEAILIESARFWWLVPLAVPALAAVLAIFIAVPAGLAWYARPGWSRALTLAGGWVLADLARQFVATGFPWNPLGSVWAFRNVAGDVMLQPASLFSVHGLTLATVLLACAPTLRRPGRAVCLVGLLLWIGFGTQRVLAPSPPDQPVRVVLVQGNVPQGQKWDPALLNSVFSRYLRLTTEAAREAAPMRTVVIWPETASPFQLATDPSAREAISAAAGGQTVLAGAVRFDDQDRPRNTLFAISRHGVIASLYDKWHLVPFGEYQPDWFPLGIQVVPGGGFASGPGPKTLHLPDLPPIGALICYEAIFPGQVVNETDRPDWMVNVTNDAWFGTSTGPRQHLAATRLRAIEEGLPLLRAANTGITAAFDPKGRELTRIEMEETGFRTVTLPGKLPPTLFARFGLPIPGLLAFAALASGLLMGRFSRRE